MDKHKNKNIFSVNLSFYMSIKENFWPLKINTDISKHKGSNYTMRVGKVV